MDRRSDADSPPPAGTPPLSERAARRGDRKERLAAKSEKREEREKKREERIKELGGAVYSDDFTAIARRGATEEVEEVVVAFAALSLRLGVEDGGAVLGLDRAHKHRAALVVADKKLSSYSSPGQAETIIRVLKEELAKMGNPEVICYGSSIGGHAAFRFAAPLGAKVALCLGPLYSTDAWRYSDPRWQSLQRRLVKSGVATLGSEMAPDCRYVTFHAAEETEEWRHFSLISRLPRVEAFLLKEGGHAVSKHLARRGQLIPLIDAVFADEPIPEEVLEMTADRDTLDEALNAAVGEVDHNGTPVEPIDFEDTEASKVLEFDD